MSDILKQLRDPSAFRPSREDTANYIEELETKLATYDLLSQAYEGDLYQAYVDANEARIDVEAERDEAWKRAAHAEKMWGEALVKLGKAVDAKQSG